MVNEYRDAAASCFTTRKIVVLVKQPVVRDVRRGIVQRMQPWLLEQSYSTFVSLHGVDN